jgi:hypothetical protein
MSNTENNIRRPPARGVLTFLLVSDMSLIHGLFHYLRSLAEAVPLSNTAAELCKKSQDRRRSPLPAALSAGGFDPGQVCERSDFN